MIMWEITIKDPLEGEEEGNKTDNKTKITILMMLIITTIIPMQMILHLLKVDNHPKIYLVISILII